MSEIWKSFGMWAVVVVWGGLALAVLLPIVARRIAFVLSDARARPIGTILCLLMLGFAIAYGGSKPDPVDPTGSDTPVTPTDPAGTSDPTEPTDPTGTSSDPSGQGDSSKSSDQSDDPSNPNDPSKASDQSDTDDPAKNEPHILYETVVGPAPAVASVYDGYLFDDKGAVHGTIQVKIGKLNGKTQLAAVKATVVIGKNKASLKADAGGKVEIKADGPTSVVLSGGETCEILLGTYALSGVYGPYIIDGARNLFASKDKAESAAANQVIAQYKAPTVVVWDGGSASVSIAAKGKSKVSVMLADGRKASAKAQFLIGEKWYCVPVVMTKNAELAFALWLSRDGRHLTVSGLGNSAVVGQSKALLPGATFHIDKTAALWLQVSSSVLTDYLPDGIAVTQSDNKWVVAKAGKVAYVKGTTNIDEAKLGENPSALKLKYNSKDGSFSGSFKIHSSADNKLKETTVNVRGVLVGNVARGSATIKNVAGAVTVTIE